jgi:hypothetical protein
MTYLWTFLAGYWTCWLVERAVSAWLKARRKPPVLRRRKYRDALPETRRDPPPMPPCKPAREVGSIRYEHLGMTDREDER